MFKVIITPMLKHINGGETRESEFTTFAEAYTYFVEWCDAHSVAVESFTENDLAFSAGGNGHDYEIEMEKI